ncbi:MAG: trehalose utilization protein ThuA [Ruminococcaceae bacterium]|nr:trehalose utilization protein ThuA [Oscillospiraceae bacterium]
MIKVTVWNEGRHEKISEEVRRVYPDGIHGALAAFLGTEEDITVRTATLDDPDCGLPQEVVDDTDVMLWWGHMAHGDVPDEVVERVANAVHAGMGLIVLHSGHHSKVFRRLMGTPCSLGWRENGDMERVWVVDPAHPITQGIDRYFELPHVETYAEPFSVPEPEKLLFIGSYEGGEVFRSGCLWRRGHGTVFYFQPGHETFPIYYEPAVQTVIKNAVRYCAPVIRQPITCPHIEKI